MTPDPATVAAAERRRRWIAEGRVMSYNAEPIAEIASVLKQRDERLLADYALATLAAPVSEEVRGAANTDRELWREVPDDFYAPSIHVTQSGGIGINVGGTVIVKTLTEWHALASPVVDVPALVMQAAVDWSMGGQSHPAAQRMAKFILSLGGPTK